jgi:hypothetical protein
MKKIWKKTLAILCIAITSIIILVLIRQIRIFYLAGVYQQLIESGLLSTETEIEWPETGNSADIEIWLLNKSDEYVQGDFIFEVTIDYSELEANFIFDERHTKDYLRHLERYMNQRNLKMSSKGNALSNFITRGRTLLEDYKGEPCAIEQGDDSLFVFNIFKSIELAPGELVRHVIQNDIPGYEMGFKNTINIKSIKPRVKFL